MIKKLLLLGLIVTQLTTSCSNDNTESTETTSENLNDQIANLIKQPYSNLTPTEQKVKLEAEANAMLVEMDKSKTSGAIEAMENLGNLLDINSVDIFNDKNDNEIEDILNVSGVYGIYTWNNTNKIWVKTTSTTELKFVFPAKASQSSNNASFSTKSISSDIKVKLIDTYGNWTYNDQTNEYVQSPNVNDYFFLPSTADAILTIDNAQAASFTLNAKYSNAKETPDDFSYKMTLNDGYTWEMSSKKAVENTSKAALTYNGKNLIEFNVGSTAKIDGLLDTDELVQYRGKANGLFRLMDNFIIVADMDLATEATDEAALEKSLIEPDYPDYDNPNADFKAFYTTQNTYNQKLSEGTVANFNKNMKLILVSKKDGTKIADIVEHSEKSSNDFNLPVWDSQYGYWSWSSNGEIFTEQYYDEISYLKFSDNTEVAMSAYFSTGFENFETKFEDFIKSFEK